MVLRGFLKIAVLKGLQDSSKSGYSLMKFLEEKVGSKPSPGSMYPLLELLKNDGLIAVKAVGRSTQYLLTSEGKNVLLNIEKKRDECVDRIIEGAKMLQTISGEDMSFCISMMNEIRRGNLPFKEIYPEVQSIREVMLGMFMDNSWKVKAPKVKRLHQEFVKKLRSL